MKIIERPILSFQENWFFSPLRNKTDYAKLMMLAARSLLIDYDTDGANITSKFKLLVDKMSRLFFYKDNKCFSVSFPFIVTLNEDIVTEIATYSGRKVDSQGISAVITVLENAQFKLNPSPIDFYIESDMLESKGLFLLEEIFRFEPGYIRYDFDQANMNGKLHPLHHLDINYSSYGTFKLGLDSQVLEAYFEDIVNITTDCSFLIK